jgi:hypothetical protein
MITHRPKFLIIVWFILVIITLIFVANSYFFGREVAAGREGYEKQISSLEKELDEISKAKKAMKNDGNDTSTKASTCASTLTSADKLEISLWSAYENSTHKVAFKYPQTWTASEENDDSVTLTDDDALFNFQFGIKNTINLDNNGYEVEKEENVTVACEEAAKTTLAGRSPGGENFNRINTEFTKNDTTYLALITYRYVGASISGDIVEAYDLILKTMELD